MLFAVQQELYGGPRPQSQQARSENYLRERSLVDLRGMYTGWLGFSAWWGTVGCLFGAILPQVG